MSFTQNIDLPITVTAGQNGVVSQMTPDDYLSGTVPASLGVSLDSGRIFYAGMMYDRLRFRSVSVAVRPKMMPSAAGVANYTFYLAWDRYKNDLVGTVHANPRIVTDDPSAKMIVWSPGGNASTLTHGVYSTYRDRYQYMGILHRFVSGSPYWELPSTASSADVPVFAPLLRYVLDIGSSLASDLTVRLIFQYRFTIEFMGAASLGLGTDAPLSRGFVGMPLAPTEEDPEATAELALRMRSLGRPLPQLRRPAMLAPGP